MLGYKLLRIFDLSLDHSDLLLIAIDLCNLLSEHIDVCHVHCEDMFCSTISDSKQTQDASPAANVKHSLTFKEVFVLPD